MTPQAASTNFQAQRFTARILNVSGLGQSREAATPIRRSRFSAGICPLLVRWWLNSCTTILSVISPRTIKNSRSPMQFIRSAGSSCTALIRTDRLMDDKGIPVRCPDYLKNNVTTVTNTRIGIVASQGTSLPGRCGSDFDSRAVVTWRGADLLKSFAGHRLQV